MLKEHAIFKLYTLFSHKDVCDEEYVSNKKNKNTLLKGDKQLLYFVSHTIQIL
jgi:hypothetical protein